MAMEINMVDNARKETVIKVVGVGGAGGNAVKHMIDTGVKGVDFIVANTDAQALSVFASDDINIIQIGDTGMGAGTKPEVGRQLAEASRQRIEDALRDADMVFIAAGMGGGTGTGASPIVAEVAKELGALTVAVVTKPFSYEGRRRMKQADEGLSELTTNVDSLIVILNEKLEEMYMESSMDEWFAHADDVLKNAVSGIVEIIRGSGKMNVDFEDVRTVMSEPGKAMMGTAVASGVDRARLAAEAAVASPLLDGADISGACGILVNITASRSLKGSEYKEVMATVNAFASPDAQIIDGLVYDEAMDDEVRVTVVATGLKGKKSEKKPEPDIHLVIRTGTDDATARVNVAGQSAVPAAGGISTNLETPAVWQRRQQSADQLRAMTQSGMDEMEIPAFLRKQAD